ncbi:YafY family transcriptional regulator [Enterococcus sp. BWB1-3]|uniref:helix-turn-helix transcriptional regulator n=1 Tax=unclassified Enterococcus TaxID=2608891 RepID=UPI001924C28E|nr:MULTISPECIES: YafY family protein [unclassified Enterococcus]MBL1230748.1 YafY family transcriptional regulator [Enterococcus sp. BWB1-3]MCB5951058.1 YafY family transcriptional regulator [Enterococcus sp. BWT-B8]
MKSERLLAITMLLLEQEQITAPKLAEIFEVSVRTIYRDIDSLSQAGIPVAALPGSNGGIRIMENYKFDQHFFTTSDLVSLLNGLNNLNKHLNLKHSPYTIEKLKSLIPKAVKNEIEMKSDQLVIDVTPWIRSELSAASIEIIQQALEKDQILSIDYENRSGNHSSRLIEPYRLILKESSWYVQAYCLQKEEFRIFKLSRIKKISIVDKIFKKRTPPPAALGKRVINEKKFVPLLLEVDYSIKDKLAERFNDLQFVSQKDSDRFLVEFPYFMTDDYGYHMLLGFGTKCKCLKPEFVQKELVSRMKEMLAFYE